MQKSDIPGPVSLHPDPETGRRSPWGAMAETTMDTSSSSRASQPAKQVCAYSTHSNVIFIKFLPRKLFQLPDVVLYIDITLSHTC